MQYFTVEKLGPSQSLTPEGFLVIRNAVIARTGHQLYSDKEVPVKGDRDGRVIIYRDEKEVFRPETIASANGKSITLDHPPEDVTPTNWRDLTVGYAVNAHRGDGVLDNFLLGDLIITVPDAIQSIRNRELVELSAGYDAEYAEDEPGKGRQKNIVINHIALVADGRCGPVCRIGDSKPKPIKFCDSEIPIIKRKRANHIHLHF